MKWTVVWNNRADRTLAQLWLDADSESRAQITLAVAKIDHTLGTSADTAGESRESDLRRILFVDPLGISYELRPDDRIANVLTVHLHGKPG